MTTKNFTQLVLVVMSMAILLLPLDTLAQSKGGGSFGGSRGVGGGGSRSYSAPRAPRTPSGSGGGSFGGTRPTSRPRTAEPGSNQTPTRIGDAPSARNSFGGTRINSSRDYTTRYGTPRKTETQSIPTGGGNRNNYVVNRYGGMGDGFMMGYMMGASPWYWGMPFHPAFYYSRPYTVANADGTTSVYPGTFQWGELFFALLLIGGLVFIAYVAIRSRRRRFGAPPSNMLDADGTKSSFI